MYRNVIYSAYIYDHLYAFRFYSCINVMCEVLRQKYTRSPKCRPVFLELIMLIWCEVLANDRFRKKANGGKPETDD